METEQHKTLYWFLDYGLDITVTVFTIAVCISWFIIAWRAIKVLDRLESSFKTIADSLAKFLRSRQ